MYAVEFETASRDGVIYIPDEYKSELGNMDSIRLVVMYDGAVQKNRELGIAKKLDTLSRLFLNSNNQITATQTLVIDTSEMCNDIS